MRRRDRSRRAARGLVLILAALLVPLVTLTEASAGSAPTAAAEGVAVNGTVRADQAAPVGSGERPLIIVLDTSGSMAEEDDTGTIKLAGAQASLTRMLRDQRPGALIGLWAYPNGGGCGPGGSVIETQPLDQASMIKAVRRLEAGGDTPTGSALRAAVDEQKRLGYSGATILLISDGLSTCDPPPCDVAQEIVDEGFDITVQAAGFQISEDGLDELRCIADATGGSALEVSDSEQLGRVVDEATRTRLTVDVRGMPDEIPAGSSARITVKVTNETQRDIQNARIAFNFANLRGTNRAIVPAVLPPLLSVGNVRVGESATHTWLVAFGARGRTGEAGYKITAWGANSQPVTLDGSVEVASGASLDTAGPLLRDLKGQRIAILGDSFSSGEGAGNYQPGTDEKGGGAKKCHKSDDTYLLPLFGRSNTELLACSGATTRYKVERTNGVQQEQVDLLLDRQRKGGPVSAAFMTIGGNDVEFAEIIKRCAFNFSATRDLVPKLWAPLPAVVSEMKRYGLSFISLDPKSRCADDDVFREASLSAPEGIRSDLQKTYSKVYESLNHPDAVKARDGEIAPLYILGYPQLFSEPQWMSRCPFFDARELEFANDLVQKLNDELEKAVRTVRRSKRYRIHLIRTTQEAFLPDNTACPRPQQDAYVNTLDFSVAGRKTMDFFTGTHTANEFMHPNALGYRAETNSILAWSTSVEEKEFRVPEQGWATPEPSRWNIVKARLADLTTPNLAVTQNAVFDAANRQWTTDPMEARAGQRVGIEIQNAAPGSQVTLTLQSRPVNLGSVAVDATGKGSATLTVPDLVPPGSHRLTAVGFAEDGSPSVAHQSIDVARYIPAWLTPLLVATLACLALGAVFVRRAKRTRARADAELGTAEDE